MIFYFVYIIIILMKTNFNYLNNQISNLKYPTDHDISRYLRDLEFLLKDVEKRIYIRELIHSTYSMRMIWDLSKEFIEYIIKNSNNPTYIKWNDNLKIIRKRRQKAAEYNKSKFIDAGFGYKSLLDSYPTPDNVSFRGVGSYYNAISIFNDLNGWMHYRYDKNYKDRNDSENSLNDKSSLFIHRSQVRFSQPNLKELVGYLETLWYVLVNVMIDSDMFEEFNDYEFDFDRDLYNDPEFAMKRLLGLKHIDDLVSGRRKCPICESGRFYKPKFEELRENNVTMPYGAYLSCDECGAKVDKTLKVKRDLKNDEFADAHCTKCNSTNSLQERFSLSIADEGIYKSCNKCSWTNKNQLSNQDIYMDDILDEIESHSFNDSYDVDDWYHED